MRYEYWVVRFVPDPIRGEYVNVGVVAGQGDDWHIRRVSNLSRASRLGGSATASKPFLNRIERMIEFELTQMESLIGSAPELLERGFVEDLRSRMNNSVQLSSPRPVLASSAVEAADLAFDLMVVDVHHEVRHRARTMAVRRLSDAFRDDPELQSHVRTRQLVAVGDEMTRIDFAVEDGEVRQLSHAWAFDGEPGRQQTNVRAWNYMMGLVRRRGAELRVAEGKNPTSLIQIPSDVEINAIYAAPQKDDGQSQLELAITGWVDLGVRAVESEDADTIVNEARELVSL